MGAAYTPFKRNPMWSVLYESLVRWNMLMSSTQHLVRLAEKCMQSSTDMPRSPFISAVHNFMTYAEGDHEIESIYLMAANFTFGHFT